MTKQDTTTEQEPPGIMYHYTSMEVLQKIIESKNDKGEITLRAGNIEYLNDPSDCKTYIECIKEAFKNSNLPFDEFSSEFLDSIEEMSLYTYIISFSEHSDSLTMWRGYGHNGKGVAIGFDTKELTKTGTNSYNLFKCKYVKKKIKPFLAKSILEYYIMNLKKNFIQTTY